MARIRKTGVWAFLLILVNVGYGQNEDPRNEGQYMDYTTMNMPESPTASAFNVVGDIQVNPAKGVPNISIPLFTYELDGVKVPISLAYDASGIKVSQMATSVGLGWSLIAGGQISRSVRSKPDEEDYDGWFENGYIRADYYGNKDANDGRWQEEMKGSELAGYSHGLVKKRDHNPDLFSYSVLNYSGSYVHDTDMNIIQESKDGIAIDELGNADDPLGAYDQEGNHFYFDYADTEQSANKNIFISHDENLPNDISQLDLVNGLPIITAWKLSKIETKNNKKILFGYESVSMEYMMNMESWQLTVGYSCDSQNRNPVKSGSGSNVEHVFTTQLLKDISSPDSNITVSFQYATDAGLPDSVWNRKLTKIIVTDVFTGNKKEFHFSYARFSGDPRLKLESVQEVAYENGNTVQKPAHGFQYQSGSLPPKDSKGQDFYGYYNLANSNKSLVPNVFVVPTYHGLRQFYDRWAGNRSLNVSALKRGVLTQIAYPTGGKTVFEYEPNVSDLHSNSGYRGGLRIKEVKNLNENNEVFNRKTYQYSDLTGEDLEREAYRWFSKSEGGTESYSSHPIRLPGDWSGFKTGYFYGKVVVTAHNDGAVNNKVKSEFYYEENPYNNQSYDYAPLSEIKYLGMSSTPVEIIKYRNEVIGSIETLEWNVVGDMDCYRPNGNWEKIGYTTSPRNVRYTGNYAYLPTQIATTQFLGENHNKPLTSLKEITYDPETLLKTKEVVDMRYQRRGEAAYVLNDAQAEQITVDYTYPFNSGHNFPYYFPKSTILKQEVKTTKAGATTKTSGQAFEFDGSGNIKKIFAYNKGAERNNSSLGYIPDDYEEMTRFLFSNGKPVQVTPRQGVSTSYIWSNTGEFPLAKIEGINRAAIGANLVSQVENAGYNELPGKLENLRTHSSLKSSMVTTFTHKPLAGVESITDPKGDVQYFEYDAFGRLVQVKDKQGKILSENEYNYAP